MTARTAVITVDQFGAAVLVPAACECDCENTHPEPSEACGLTAERGQRRCAPCQAATEADDLDFDEAEELDWLDFAEVA